MKVIIAGAGIGGLVTALFLQQQHVECMLYESVAVLRELGAGITLLPHAVEPLSELGLLPKLDEIAIRTEYLYFRTRQGRVAWEENRGLKAGYPVPQFAVHRGRLQLALWDAVTARLPAEALHLGHQLVDFTQDQDGVSVRFRLADGSETVVIGDVLIGADGIHSGVRRTLFPNEGAPRWSGRMLWRGATEWPVFLDGKTVIITGGLDRKFVVYPIGQGTSEGTRLTNWAAVVRVAEPGTPTPRREDWSSEALREELAPLLKEFHVPETSIEGLVAATPVFWDYPMCDREPLPHWTRGRVTLLGDAAHPMYPFGANGAAQAILDARCVASCLASCVDPVTALIDYETERRAPANLVVNTNRAGGPERVIDAVEALAPDGFISDMEAVLPYEQRKAIVRGYAQTAGFALRECAEGKMVV